MTAGTAAPGGKVFALYRYPVKGLTPEPERCLELAAGSGLAHDRAYALALGTTEFDAAAPKPLAKTNFLMLARNESLAALRTRFDSASGTLHVRHGDEEIAGDLGTEAGRARIEEFFTAYAGEAAKGRVRLVSTPGHRFTDIGAPVPAFMHCISLVNLASLRELEGAMGRSLDPRRFRANVYVDGLPPWAEWDWIGAELPLGRLRVRAVRRTRRCPATNVDPDTAERDSDVPAALRRHFGHADLGVYLEVLASGVLAVGDGIAAPETGPPPWSEAVPP